MVTRFDWTVISDNPKNFRAKALAADILSNIRQLHLDANVLRFIERQVSGRRVLDVGMADHSEEQISNPNWRHDRIAAAASYCLGIDILEDLIHLLADRGYNVRVANAISNEDLGERFDIVFNGDIIEHVDNPVALLKFSARHLSPRGRIFVSTPNPFSRKFVDQLWRQNNMIVNLDHVSWVTPTMALEIARRSGLRLVAVHLVKPMSRIKQLAKLIQWKWEPVEYTFPDYVYEFAAD